MKRSRAFQFVPPPPPPHLSGFILFATPDALAILLHGDLVYNGKCSVSVTGAYLTGVGGLKRR